ncbi:hypothetical protein [Streptomyces tanashiensis]|uniref:hypothetical protein n=1 Tax=Streptomyces tanashiensis TaxID=67367 RepID=UPI0033F10EC0
MTCSNSSSWRSNEAASAAFAGFPVSERTATHLPDRAPLASRLRSATVAYAEAGTSLAASLWSASDWSPEDWTGFTMKTRA